MVPMEVLVSWIRRRDGSRAATAALVAFGATSVAIAAPLVYAAVGDPTPASPPFVVGAPIAASQLNDNFKDLYERIASIENSATANPFCGLTPTRYQGNFAASAGTYNGYDGAAVLCKQAAPCGAGVHICSAQEVMLALSRGTSGLSGDGNVNQVWYAAGVTVPGIGASTFSGDCNGWLSNSSGDVGPVWLGRAPTYNGCNASYQITCCD